jgi:predicted TIM-barrel fold metal-dependent hydrolase
VIEPPSLWREYLDPEFREFAPSADMKIKGEAITTKVSTQVEKQGNQQMAKAHPNAYAKSYDAESHVQAMVQMGIDIAFLYPTYGLWLWSIDPMAPQVAGAFIRAYNRWLLDYCSYDPTRLRGVGAINLHAPEQMVSELEHIAELGWKAVFLRPNPVKGRLLSDRAYEPFWAACEEMRISIGIHESTHSRLPTTGADRFHTRFALHACSHPMEQMMALLALIEGGVLERYPNLKVAFLESGCSWLPYWLWRLDEEYENLHWEVKDTVKLKPSEYFCRQCFITAEPSEPLLGQTIQYLGPDTVIFSSDYPHMDHKPGIVKEAVGLEEKLSQNTVKKMLWDNPVQFYGIEA